jgi:hypothetical protein
MLDVPVVDSRSVNFHGRDLIAQEFKILYRIVQ